MTNLYFLSDYTAEFSGLTVVPKPGNIFQRAYNAVKSDVGQTFKEGRRGYAKTTKIRNRAQGVVSPTLGTRVRSLGSGIKRGGSALWKTKTGKYGAIGLGGLAATGAAIGGYKALTGRKKQTTVVNNY